MELLYHSQITYTPNIDSSKFSIEKENVIEMLGSVSGDNFGPKKSHGLKMFNVVPM